MLPDFMSRCTKSFLWAKPSAAATSSAISATRAGGERAVGLDDLGQAAALHVLHDDVVGAAFATPVVHADDVGVVQVGGGLRLATEPLDERGVGGELREQHLDRHRAVEQLIAGEEHFGHPATGEASMQLVTPAEDGWALVGHGGRSVVRAGARRSPVHRRARSAGAQLRPAAPDGRWVPPCRRRSVAPDPGTDSTITATATVGS